MVLLLAALLAAACDCARRGARAHDLALRAVGRSHRHGTERDQRSDATAAAGPHDFVHGLRHAVRHDADAQRRPHAQFAGRRASAARRGGVLHRHARRQRRFVGAAHAHGHRSVGRALGRLGALRHRAVRARGGTRRRGARGGAGRPHHLPLGRHAERTDRLVDDAGRARRRGRAAEARRRRRRSSTSSRRPSASLRRRSSSTSGCSRTASSSNGTAAAPRRTCCRSPTSSTVSSSASSACESTWRELRTYGVEPDAFTGTNASALLNQLEQHKFDTPALRSKGLVHLFTGRDLDERPNTPAGGRLLGVANLGVLCHARDAAGLTQYTDLNTAAVVAAHEIGHNFGAPHDTDAGSACQSVSDGYLMAPFVNGSRTFSECSVQQMEPQLAAATCFTNLPANDLSVQRLDGPAEVIATRTFNVAFAVDYSGPAEALEPLVTITAGNLTRQSLTAGLPAVCEYWQSSPMTCRFGRFEPRQRSRRVQRRVRRAARRARVRRRGSDVAQRLQPCEQSLSLRVQRGAGADAGSCSAHAGAHPGAVPRLPPRPIPLRLPLPWRHLRPPRVTVAAAEGQSTSCCCCYCSPLRLGDRHEPDEAGRRPVHTSLPLTGAARVTVVLGSFVLGRVPGCCLRCVRAARRRADRRRLRLAVPSRGRARRALRAARRRGAGPRARRLAATEENRRRRRAARRHAARARARRRGRRRRGVAQLRRHGGGRRGRRRADRSVHARDRRARHEPQMDSAAERGCG